MASKDELKHRMQHLPSNIKAARAHVGFGLSTKLIAIIGLVILLVEIVIYLTSIANFRANWLDNKMSVANVATVVWSTTKTPAELPNGLKDQLLDSAGASLIAYRQNDRRHLLQHSIMPPPENVHLVDIAQRDFFPLVLGAVDTLINGENRILRIKGQTHNNQLDNVELVVAENPLRAGMLAFSMDILLLSLVIAVITSLLVYGILYILIVRPMRRLTTNLIAYRNAPEDIYGIIDITQRRDEIGIAQRELRQLETDLFSILQQRKHLAELGLAVAKINHDLRNTLASAQLLCDQVADLNDPKVQRLAPQLVNTLDKAIGFCQSVLDYGRQRATPPRLDVVNMFSLANEAAFEAGLSQHPQINFNNDISDQITLCVDPDQIARVLTNIFKNARQAHELEIARCTSQSGGDKQGCDQLKSAYVTIKHSVLKDSIRFQIIDNGPGLPTVAKQHMFKAFQGSARRGGTGLGLCIAKELVKAHGGQLRFIDNTKGTCFELELPHIVDQVR